MKRLRVLFHVQHLLGIGHFRRALTIARALADGGLEVVLASGGEPVPDLPTGPVELVQLPPAVAADAAFSGLLDADRQPVDESWRDRRREALLALFERVQPQALLVELFPFGRRAFRFELLPLLAAARARRRRPAVLCSLRDILVGGRKPERAAEAVALARRYFDRVLVHGDPRLIRLEETLPSAAELLDRLHYTGYVVAGAADRPRGDGAGLGEVLVSAGGGAVGLPLLQAALEARPLSALGSRTWRLITGPAVGPRMAGALADAAPDGVIVERFRPDFAAMLARCRVSVSQAGYNTVMEILSVGARAVVVPFAEGRESEQTLRARRLAERGLLTLLEPEGLRPAGLAAAIDAAAGRPPAIAPDIALDGGERTAAIVAELAQAAAQGRLASAKGGAS